MACGRGFSGSVCPLCGGKSDMQAAQEAYDQRRRDEAARESAAALVATALRPARIAVVVAALFGGLAGKRDGTESQAATEARLRALAGRVAAAFGK